MGARGCPVVPARQCPSYVELATENGELRALVGTLTARLDTMEAENAELMRKLGQNSQNSQNSSEPPSSDSPFGKPAPKSFRRKNWRRR
ncbi:MAG: DUF6444 domain-containing protein, partial [Sciscionella sp.]